MRLADKIILAFAFGMILLGCIFGVAARGEPAPQPQCPTAQPCKVLTLTQEEEQALIGERSILDTALQGRPLDLGGAVTYFREKIRTAPAGQPKQ